LPIYALYPNWRYLFETCMGREEGRFIDYKKSVERKRIRGGFIF